MRTHPSLFSFPPQHLELTIRCLGSFEFAGEQVMESNKIKSEND